MMFWTRSFTSATGNLKPPIPMDIHENPIFQYSFQGHLWHKEDREVNQSSTECRTNVYSSQSKPDILRYFQYAVIQLCTQLSLMYVPLNLS